MDSDLGFSVLERRNGEVCILHRGRVAATLRGAKAVEFLDEIAQGSEADGQQLMARLTGNYKRGNERQAQAHPRNRGG